MITYELAKQLKDAGFPQDKSIWIWVDDPVNVNTHKWYESLRQNWVLDKVWDWVASPTLSELIEACGDDYYFFLNSTRTKSQPNTWAAFVKDNEGREKFISFGDTPEEAVAKLYIALKETNGTKNS